MKTLSKDFTRGNITRRLILFSLPFMASNAMQVLYSTIDMIIVGHFVGTAGLSAVSQSSQIVKTGYPYPPYSITFRQGMQDAKKLLERIT